MIARPILFSAQMVRAILAGDKTQTRRIIKPQPPKPAGTLPQSLTLVSDEAGENLCAVSRRAGHGGWFARCPYGQPGDHLWVRETWAVDASMDQARREHEDMMPGLSHGPYFRADGVHENSGLTWRPAIHMPRWASRITLWVTGVRVERLQEISQADAHAEGVPLATFPHHNPSSEAYSLIKSNSYAMNGRVKTAKNHPEW